METDIPKLPAPTAVAFFSKPGYQLKIWKSAYTVELTATLINEAGGRMCEELRLVKRGAVGSRDWWFRIVRRTADAKVPITDVIKRHASYPVGKIVILKGTENAN